MRVELLANESLKNESKGMWLEMREVKIAKKLNYFKFEFKEYQISYSKLQGK